VEIYRDHALFAVEAQPSLIFQSVGIYFATFASSQIFLVIQVLLAHCVTSLLDRILRHIDLNN